MLAAGPQLVRSQPGRVKLTREQVLEREVGGSGGDGGRERVISNGVQVSILFLKHICFYHFFCYISEKVKMVGFKKKKENHSSPQIWLCRHKILFITLF